MKLFDRLETDNHMADRLQAVVRSGQVIDQRLKDDGYFPNNESLPLLIYQGALALPQRLERFLAQRYLWISSLPRHCS